MKSSSKTNLRLFSVSLQVSTFEISSLPKKLNKFHFIHFLEIFKVLYFKDSVLGSLEIIENKTKIVVVVKVCYLVRP